MITPLEPDAIVVVWTVLGLFVGSFLNVVIHRFPLEGQTIASPRRSRCPKCETELTWKENLPLLSWLVQLGKCRTCSWRIPFRYPLVEALTAGLWFLAANAALVDGPEPGFDWGRNLVFSLVLSGLVVATFVDFACWEIPDEVSIGGMWLAPIASLLVPELHEHTRVALAVSDGGSVDRFGALVGSLAGLAVGGGCLLFVGWVGSRVFRKDAMGFGDVKLLAAGGGFVGPGGALAALMVASLFGAVFGVANMVRFFLLTRSRGLRRGHPRPLGRSLRIAHLAAQMLPFGPYLALGIGIALLYWNHVLALFA